LLAFLLVVALCDWIAHGSDLLRVMTRKRTLIPVELVDMLDVGPRPGGSVASELAKSICLIQVIDGQLVLLLNAIFSYGKLAGYRTGIHYHQL
jgi:hypothetical protein